MKFLKLSVKLAWCGAAVFLLLAFSHAHAETKPLVSVYVAGWWGSSIVGTGATCPAAEAAWFAQAGGTQSGSGCNGDVRGSGEFCQTDSRGVRRCYGSVGWPSQGCDSGWTQNGTVCTRPDCPTGQTRKSDGTCGCQTGQTLKDGVCKTNCPDGYHARTPDDGKCEKDCIGEQVQSADGTCGCAKTGNRVYQFTAAAAGKAGCDAGCTTSLFAGVAYCTGTGLAATWATGLPVASGTGCYAYGQRTGDTCDPNVSVSGRVTVTMVRRPPPADPVQNVTPTNPPNPTLPPADTSGKAADGVTADPKNTPDNAIDPVACGTAGGSYGVFNGVGKCLTKTNDNSMDKLTTKTTSTTTTNSDSSSSTTKTTEVTGTNTGTGTSTTVTTSSTTTKNSSGAETGTSTTSGTSTSGGGSDGTCDPKKDFCSAPGTDDLYQKKDKTVKDVIQKFSDAVKTTPMGQSMTNFFNVSISGGSCPAWAVDVPFLNVNLNIGQYFCTAAAIDMMNLAGSVLLIGAMFVAFRVAFL